MICLCSACFVFLSDLSGRTVETNIQGSVCRCHVRPRCLSRQIVSGHQIVCVCSFGCFSVRSSFLSSFLSVFFSFLYLLLWFALSLSFFSFFFAFFRYVLRSFLTFCVSFFLPPPPLLSLVLFSFSVRACVRACVCVCDWRTESQCSTLLSFMFVYLASCMTIIQISCDHG